MLVGTGTEAMSMNGTMGMVVSICYCDGEALNIPIAIMLYLDPYQGPSLPDGTVPITPICRTWSASGDSVHA